MPDREFITQNKRYWRFLAALLVFMVTAVCFSGGRQAFGADIAADTETQVNTTLGENMEYYAGIFSTTVTTSVNPTATLAVLSVVGMVENSHVYFPNTKWLIKLDDMLENVPFVRTAETLPISNPTAAVILTVITIALYVMRSVAAAKAFSEATIDKVEQTLGYVVTVALSLLPLAQTEIASAADPAQPAKKYMTAFSYMILAVIAVLSAIFNALVYMVIYNCIDAVEFIAVAIPVNGANLVTEILKMILHAVLVVLQIFSPVLSVIFSVILLIVGIVLFRILTVMMTYYKYVYIQPLMKAIFHHGDASQAVHKKFPRKAQKLYPDVVLAVPIFSMNDHYGILKKREMLWLVDKNPGVCLMRMRRFRKPLEIDIASINRKGDPLYLHKAVRFNRICTEDRRVELIFSSEYSDRFADLLTELDLSDYQIVLNRKKDERDQKAKEQMDKWKGKFNRIATRINGSNN